MSEFLETLREVISPQQVARIVTAAVFLFAGYLVARSLRRAVERVLAARLTAQHKMIAGRGTFYLVFGLAAAVALHHSGFDLGILLGAAGILTVAVGFAAQTSMSNLISGLFLIAESPMNVGDTIRVGGTTGVVLSIDLLSVRLRKFDNTLVRLPNETLLKSEILNLTRFPIRRVDVLVGVAYKEDLRRVRELLTAVADRLPRVLDEPRPQFFFQGFGDSSLDLQFSVWTTRENYLEVKNEIHVEIKNAFDAAGIEIPFPHRTLYAGSVTEPFPVRTAAS